MDEIDFIILKKLIENSRVTYRELAEIIGMSITTIHKRINNLINDGIISAFIARPSIIALRGLIVVIYGTSKAKSVDNVCKELGQHESIVGIGIAGGKFLSICCYLRNISELQDLSSFVSNTSQISEPIIGIVNIPYMAR